MAEPARFRWRVIAGLAWVYFAGAVASLAVVVGVIRPFRAWTLVALLGHAFGAILVAEGANRRADPHHEDPPMPDTSLSTKQAKVHIILAGSCAAACVVAAIVQYVLVK